MSNNPLLKDWSQPKDMPFFSEINIDHYQEAFDTGIKQHEAEIDQIKKNKDTPTFENTVIALENSGRALGQVCSVFFNLASADTNEKLQEIEIKIGPKLAEHGNKIFLDSDLFKRVEAIWLDKENLGLNDEQVKLLERSYKSFCRSGAQLDSNAKQRMSQISQRQAELGTKFSQNVLKDEAEYKLFLETEQDLEGLPDFLIKSASQTAKDLGHEGKKIITLSRSSIEPFLQFSKRRDLREKIFKAWIERGGNAGATDNSEIIKEIVELRAETAKLLGFKNFSEYKLDDSMAKSPEAVRDLLGQIWPKAKKKAIEERDELQEIMTKDGINDKLQPWDWRYYSEKVRKEKYDIDEAEIKPYFQLDHMIEAAFFTANKLFGVTFEELENSEKYHPDVRVWDVKDKGGNFIARFVGDYFARPSKRGGAWMSNFRSQEKLNGDITPIIINVLNFVKGGEGEPAILTFDDAETLFHEFGHGLHGMLSDVTYPSLSGTSVVRDFVELPSQLYEHWLAEPEVLQKYAIHSETKEIIPESLMKKLLSAKNYGQGFMTIEYLSCAILDIELHENSQPEDFNIQSFEKKALEGIGMLDEIVMRHRLPHFSHLFAGGGYASGYYSYMWSEVMDADAFSAFKETGDAFNPEMAEKLKKYIYSSGGKFDPEVAYQKFRGKKPSVEALLENRGL